MQYAAGPSHPRFKHGNTTGYRLSPTYMSWKAMKARCSNPNTREYARYGGRGILVCSRWVDSFANFLEDMGERPHGKTLDRVNNDLGYSPDNCRWASQIEQVRNSSRARIITALGLSLRLHEWAVKLDVTAPALRYRLSVYPPSVALSPSFPSRRRR